jgi:hypothetical protein
MKRLWIILLLLALAAVLVRFARKPVKAPDTRVTAATQRSGAPNDEVLIGEKILERYAAAATSPREDLEAIHRVLQNFSLLVKGGDPLPLGANEEIAAALLGKNKASLRMLSNRSAAFNDKGQLVDRWGTPLYFHAHARDRIDIRSAGPDRAMWTEDDIHREHNGHFLSTEELLPASLYKDTRSPYRN